MRTDVDEANTGKWAGEERFDSLARGEVERIASLPGEARDGLLVL
jgi:hypothetical protein